MLIPLCFALAIALAAVVWSVILVDDGMLLAPAQAALRGWHRRRWLSLNPAEEMGVLALNKREQEYYAGNNLDKRWWWKPIWGCERCCAGNWATWGIPLMLWLRTEDLQHFLAAYDPFTHLFIICASIYLAAILTKIYQWSQQ